MHILKDILNLLIFVLPVYCPIFFVAVIYLYYHERFNFEGSSFKEFKQYLIYFDYTEGLYNKTRSLRCGCWRSVILQRGRTGVTDVNHQPLMGNHCPSTCQYRESNSDRYHTYWGGTFPKWTGDPLPGRDYLTITVAVTFITAQAYMSRDMTKPTKWVCVQRRHRSAWASASHWAQQRRLWSNWADVKVDLSLR